MVIYIIYMHSYISSQHTYRIAKNAILTVIATAMLMVLVFTIFSLIATPEFLTKREIETITADYYENYFYPNILSSNSLTLSQVKSPQDAESLLSNILDKYTETGFSRITLNQLLLFDNRRHYSAAASLANYCNLDNTIIKIYPEPPYTINSYHADYDYSCKF